MTNNDDRGLDNAKTQSNLSPMNLEQQSTLDLPERVLQAEVNSWCIALVWTLILGATRVLGCHFVHVAIIFTPIVVSSLALWLTWLVVAIVTRER